MAPKYSDPQTFEQWQEAVDTAAFLLQMTQDRGCGYEIIGPTANIPRCMDIVELGHRRGIIPAPNYYRRGFETFCEVPESEVLPPAGGKSQ